VSTVVRTDSAIIGVHVTLDRLCSCKVCECCRSRKESQRCR